MQTYRTVILALAVLSIVVTAAELAIARHWDGLAQLVPWALLGIVLVAVGLLVVRPNRALLNLARVLGVMVVVGALFGVYKHIEGNYHDGSSPQAFGAEWESMPESERWWKAANGSVGEMAPLAPLVLAFSGSLVLGATLHWSAGQASGEREEKRAELDQQPRRRAS